MKQIEGWEPILRQVYAPLMDLVWDHVENQVQDCVRDRVWGQTKALSRDPFQDRVEVQVYEDLTGRKSRSWSQFL